jgi:hypothetical protein
MSEIIGGVDIGVTAFLGLEEDMPLGICIFHQHGGSYITLEEFLEESKGDLSTVLRQRYACAFEVMAKQLRDGI